MLDDVAVNNTTVVVSSHNLRELEDVCDHVGILNKGKKMCIRDSKKPSKECKAPPMVARLLTGLFLFCVR